MADIRTSFNAAGNNLLEKEIGKMQKRKEKREHEECKGRYNPESSWKDYLLSQHICYNRKQNMQRKTQWNVLA